MKVISPIYYKNMCKPFAAL